MHDVAPSRGCTQDFRAVPRARHVADIARASHLGHRLIARQLPEGLHVRVVACNLEHHAKNILPAEGAGVDHNHACVEPLLPWVAESPAPRRELEVGAVEAKLGPLRSADSRHCRPDVAVRRNEGGGLAGREEGGEVCRRVDRGVAIEVKYLPHALWQQQLVQHVSVVVRNPLTAVHEV